MKIHALSKPRIALLAVCAGLALIAAALLSATLRPQPDATMPTAQIPAGTYRLGSREIGGLPPHEISLSTFLIGTREITTGEYAQFRNESSWRSKAPQMPATHLCIADARAYCAWLGAKLGKKVRLPTEDEWECAARGGIRGAPFPWGWDSPEGRAAYHADAPHPAASFAANGYGLFDCAGNVAEWCEPSSPTSAVAIARGGSYADRDDGRLKVFRRVEFPRDYRDADVGFRIVIEP